MNWWIRWYNYFYPKQLLIPYENIYPLGTTKESIMETDENIQNKRVGEITPDGNVMLSYDKDCNTFLYWSKKKIAYKYLEVLARKYVILYDCKELYINMFRELWKSSVKVAPLPLMGPFATFKPYNTIAHKLDARRIVNESANQYKYMGEMVIITSPTFKDISYRDFKNKMYDDSNERV